MNHVAPVAHAEQRTANDVTASPDETDPRGSRTWVGCLDISMKQKDGQVKTKRIPVSGDVSVEGVPVTITIPAAAVGAADMEFGLFYDQDLNLQLVGNNNVPHPRVMRRVK